MFVSYTVTAGEKMYSTRAILYIHPDEYHDVQYPLYEIPLWSLIWNTTAHDAK